MNTREPQIRPQIPAPVHQQINSEQDQTLSPSLTNSTTQTECIPLKHKKNNRNCKTVPLPLYIMPTAIARPLRSAHAVNIPDNDIQADTTNNVIEATQCTLDLDFTMYYQKHLAIQRRQKKINADQTPNNGCSHHQAVAHMQPQHQIINPHQRIRPHNQPNQTVPYYPQNRPVSYQYPQPMYQQYQYSQLCYYPNTINYSMPMNQPTLYVHGPQRQDPRIFHRNLRK